MNAAVVSRAQSRSGLGGLLVSLAVAAAMILFAGLALADGHKASGSFVGKSNHVTSGEVTVEKTADGYVLVLHDNFSFDGAPDPQLGLGKSMSNEDIPDRMTDLISGENIHPDSFTLRPYQYVWLTTEDS